MRNFRDMLATCDGHDGLRAEIWQAIQIVMGDHVVLDVSAIADEMFDTITTFSPATGLLSTTSHA